MKVIVHIPWELKSNQFSATAIRPKEIVSALKQEGHQVYLIWGKGAQRKRRFKELIRRINNGESFDFIYSESSTVPNFFAGGLFQGLLYGFMDHWYLLRLKIKGLRTILFYRDLYWTFSSVMRHTPLIKRILFYCFYWVDLFFYRFYLSKIVFPSSNMHRWFPWKVFSFGVLSPGLREPQEHRTQLPEKRPLTLFYVGGMGSSYRLDKIFQVIENTPGVEATFCVRKEEWAKEQGKYQSAVRSGRIQIIHKEKNELGPYLAQADIGVLFLEPSDVRLFMLPLKVFEYIEYGLPVLSSAGTIAGDFIIQEGLGWALPYQESAIEDWFQKAVSNIFEIRSQRRAILMKAQNHTWRHRVQELIAMIKGPKQ